MFLGALIDAGFSMENLQSELAKLQLTDYEVDAKPVSKNGIRAVKAIVRVSPDQPHRGLGDIEQIIEASTLDDPVKSNSLQAFRLLAEAEAKIHGTTPEKIHFHEVGAMDAIIDVVGTMAGLAALGISKLYCSPLNVGGGTVTCAHGTLPVPAPAVLELLTGVPIYSSGINHELLTPTGAVILKTRAESFGPLIPIRPGTVGCGAGSADLCIPNVLRLIVGEAA